MAALFDLDTERYRRVDEAFGVIVDHVRALDPASAIAQVQVFQSRLSGLHAEATAKLYLQTGSDRAAKRAMNDGKTSKRSMAKAARRGDAAAKNSSLADKVANGDLSTEQLDVIADASAKTDGAAAADSDFVDEIGSVDPDQGETIKDAYLAKEAKANGTQTEHDRQRALRRAVRYVSKKKGLDVIAIEGDAVATNNMWKRIEKRARELYKADGGRDVAASERPRTYQQRLNDAAYELICNVTTTSTGVTHTPRHADGQAKPGPPQIFIGMTLDHYLGRDPAAVATQIGLGAIADTVLFEYLEHADILGVLYDKNGQPLWLGRARRDASLMQRYALVLRDKGCVRCGADHGRCVVHHTMPWNAPAKGTTDLDLLALLCTPCHTQLHADNQTLFRDGRGIWRTRPALPHETPPARPNNTHKRTENISSDRNQPKRE